MIKVVMVRLDGSEADELRLRALEPIARRFEAHVIGLSINVLPLLPADAGVAAADLIGKAREFGDQAQVTLAQQLAKVSTRSELRRFDVFPQAVADTAAREARTADTFLTLRPASRDTVEEARDLVEAVLFGSGRHVLLAPPEPHSGGHFDHVMIAWNRSREAARAIGEALPYLHLAQLVTVLVVDTESPVEFMADIGADAVNYLRHHRLPATLHRTKARKDDVGASLVEQARERDADLLVMGGYGHSRLREWLTGGVTRYLLRHVTVPLLIAH